MKVRVVPTEVFSRVVGYYRPIQNWHRGKLAEFELRKTIDPETVVSREESTEEAMFEGMCLEAEDYGRKREIS